MSTKAILFSTFLLFLIAITSCNQSRPVADDSIKENLKNTNFVSEEKQLREGLETILARYHEKSELADNFRRRKAGAFRYSFISQALMAYWHINDSYPSATSASEVIQVLESAHLIPFISIDPSTSEPFTLVSSKDDIRSYSDVFAELTPEGVLNYTLMQYKGSDYTPVVEFRDQVKFTSGLSHYMVTEKETPDGVVEVEIPLYSNSAEVFQNMIYLEFMEIIPHSFIMNDCKVPISLKELLAGVLTINPDGWGHPTGKIPDGEAGSFEIGVDPSLNAYYVTTTTERLGTVTIAEQFYKKIIDGTAVFDLRFPDQMIRVIDGEELHDKIPLLTDELFAGPPPEI